MDKKIVYLPLDERPCNYIYPQYIAKCASVNFVTAPMSLMGRFKKPADIDGLWTWLFEEAKNASHVVMSTDLLLYGGIVPSRLHYFSKEKCLERIELIKKLKQENPKLVIYAFSLITRAPARNGSGEEPDYYEQHGYDIHRFGVVEDMLSLNVDAKDAADEKAGILQRVPQEYLSDFSWRRNINFFSNIKLIELAASGILDHLIIPLDDCKEFGWAPAERKRLAKYAAEKDMLSKISMYPGADEIGCTLTAKAICNLTQVSPNIFFDYTSNTGAITIPSYEDRTIGETAPHHVLNCGGQIAFSLDECDAVMFINPPTKFSQRLEKELDRREFHFECERNLSAFVNRAKKYIKLKKPCFIADCAIPNGADKCLMQFMYEQNLLDDFTGYSGWNTSSNAMGTVVALAIAYACAKSTGRLTPEALEACEEFKMYRYIEDWGYMVEVRKTLTEHLDEFGEGLGFLNLADKEPLVAQAATKMLAEFTRKYLKSCKYSPHVRMPWNRMFEVDLTLTLND